MYSGGGSGESCSLKKVMMIGDEGSERRKRKAMEKEKRAGETAGGESAV